MTTAEQTTRRVRRCVFWLVAALGVGLPLLWFGYLFARHIGRMPDLASYFNPAGATSDPAPVPFDQATWNRGRTEDRIAIAKWVVENGIVIGQSREELTARFGPSDYECEHQDKQQLTWNLGDLDTGKLFVRHMKLLVKLDHTRKVVDARIYSTD